MVSDGEGLTQEDAAHLPSGPLANAISTAFVKLTKKHGGKGPTRCRTYVETDMVIIVSSDGGTLAEQTLFEAGKWLDVRTARQSFQDSMKVRFIEELEGLTMREVHAFMSASHQDPDFQVTLFVLKPNGDSANKTLTPAVD